MRRLNVRKQIARISHFQNRAFIVVTEYLDYNRPIKKKKQRLEIIYEDDTLLVVNKPPGLLSVPDRYSPELPYVASVMKRMGHDVFVVHRLDRDTSGVMVLARSEESHRFLNTSFENGTVRKSYTAIVANRLLSPSVTIDLPLRPNGDRKHRTVVDRSKGKPATTELSQIERFREYSVVEARPTTGRTHQIRVHLASVGCPIVADDLYGDGQPLLLSSFKRNYSAGRREERPLISRLALHASTLHLVHPESREEMEFESPLPKDLRAAINQLSRHGR